MQANIITFVRIALVFLTVWLFTLGFYFRLIATVFTIIVIYMDALDGYIARKLGVSSDFGALLDIAGDRIVENIYWIFFSWIGLISYWVPIIVVTRGFLTDLIRVVAFADGKTPFGKKTHLDSKVARFICASKTSRGIYGGAKVASFVWLGLYLTFQSGIEKYGWSISSSYMTISYNIGLVLVYTTVVMCVVRGIPVLWEARDLLFAKNYRLKE
jgi:CDP-diacylglycerol--glycerol-3-phosphate 3-phosphatidyltransferase